jgi:hypothetical protein
MPGVARPLFEMPGSAGKWRPRIARSMASSVPH